MTNFIKLAIAPHYSESGAPSIYTDDQWVNLDLIVTIEEQLGSNLGTTAKHGAPEEHYPCLVMVDAHGRRLLVPLGTTSTATEGMRVIDEHCQLYTNSAPGPATLMAVNN